MKLHTSSVIFRSMKPGEETAVVELVSKVFNEFVAPLYSDEGNAEFRKYISAEYLADRFKNGNIVHIAEFEGKIIGVIEIRDSNHVSLLFVERSHQGKGVARGLVQKAIMICQRRNPETRKITVHSSPNAYAAYHALGFEAVDNEKVVHGIRFIPMELRLKSTPL